MIANFSRFYPLTLLLFAIGCDSGAEQLAPVKGKVFYKAAPLPGGTIVFTPDASRGYSGEMASAEIQSDGSYALHTGSASGAPIGSHRVTIVSVVAPEAISVGKGFAIPRSRIPDRYRDPQLSDLKAKVDPGKENGINFNLE